MSAPRSGSVSPVSTSLVKRSARSIVQRAFVIALVAFALALGGWFLVKPVTAHRRAPVADAPHVEGKRIVFSERFAKRIGLRTGEVTRSNMVPTIAVIGTVTFNPEHVARIGTRLRGLVRDVRHYEGDTVKRGESLAQIDSPELGEAQASVTMLQAQLDAARRNSEREKDLAEQRLTTLKESEEAAATKNTYTALLGAAQQKVAALSGSYSKANARALGVHELVSQIDGSIVERHISKGQLVEGDHTAFVVANLDYLWVELAVFERHLSEIRAGDAVELRPLGSKSEPLHGRVAHVGNVLSPETRSATIRVAVDNKNRLLRPGQAVDAIIKISEATVSQGILVPKAAVTFVDGRPTVFVADTPTSVVATEVELGASDGSEQQLDSGIQAGQRVVIEGTFELKSELFR